MTPTEIAQARTIAVQQIEVWTARHDRDQWRRRFMRLGILIFVNAVISIVALIGTWGNR